jgi:hypothetical protein
MTSSHPTRERNLENAAIYLRTHVRKPRAWGELDTPPGTLHAKDIEVGLGLDSADGRRLYLNMNADGRFDNPTPNSRASCELTESGEAWAQLLVQARAT